MLIQHYLGTFVDKALEGTTTNFNTMARSMRERKKERESRRPGECSFVPDRNKLNFLVDINSVTRLGDLVQFGQLSKTVATIR